MENKQKIETKKTKSKTKSKPKKAIAYRGSVQQSVAKNCHDSNYVSNLWKFTLAVSALNTERVYSPAMMQERIQKLFKLCTETNNVPTYENIAQACGLPLTTLYEMRTNKRAKHEPFYEILEEAKIVITSMESSMARDGKIAPSLWQFRAKNYLGMQDVQKIEAVTPESGDVPQNSEDMLASLPDVPDNKDAIEVNSEQKKE